MIKKLRTRFIVIAMACVIGVMTIIVTFINIATYNQTLESGYETIDFLSEFNKSQNKGQPFMEKPSQKPGEEHAPKEEHKGEKPSFEKSKVSPEKPFSARYFTVCMDKNGSVLEINTEQISSVSSDTAKAIAKECFTNNKTQGVYNHLVYKQVPCEEGTHYFFLNCEDDFAYFHSFLWISIAISFGGIALVLVLVWIFSGIAMKPIAESYEKQKRFITDAGHELKTPLTIIDANAEVLEMEKGESQWIQSIRNQVKRLSELTQNLVFLSRMEEEQPPITLSEFSLTDAITETATPFEAVATAGGKTLEISCKEGVTYKGDESTLRQLVSLLLDNAMKYSPEKGTITVSLTENGKKKQLTITNTVEKTGSASPALWFDRFYRQDHSRNSDTGGHGIGLSVAQAIVNAHKGKITAAYQKENQVVITVTL